MAPSLGAADRVAPAGTADQRESSPIVSSRCLACYRPIASLSAVCRECMRWHFRLQALAASVHDEEAR